MELLRILGRGARGVLLSWPGHVMPGVTYVIEGLTDIFGFEVVKRTDACEAVVSGNYPGYRVLYMKDGVVFDSTELVRQAPMPCADGILIDMMDGLSSVTVWSDGYHDLYRVLDKDGKMLAESEDCVLIGRLGGARYVECCDLDGDKYRAVAAGRICGLDDSDAMAVDGRPDVSVIIPIWNRALFVPRTVQSVVSQDFDGHTLEIILADDGSDEPLVSEICSWYAANYGNIRYVRLDAHGGLSAVRNFGLSFANGRYIQFLDSDDVLHPYFYKRLLAAAEAHGADVAVAETIIREKSCERYKHVFSNTARKSTHSMTYPEMLAAKGTSGNIFFVSTCNKIARAETVRRVAFDPEHGHYEDVGYTGAMYSWSDRLVFVPDAWYMWDKRQRETVGTVSVTKKNEPGWRTWTRWMWAESYVLRCGNLSPDRERAVKADVLRVILQKYIEFEAPRIRFVIGSMLKYLVETHGLFFSYLTGKPDAKLYAAYAGIMGSDLPAWDGQGELPMQRAT